MLGRHRTESRLRIMQLLLTAHPDGMVAGEIQTEIGVSASNLSHHLEKLKHAGVIEVKREGSFSALHGQHGSASGTADVPLLRVLRPSKAIKPDKIVQLCK